MLIKSKMLSNDTNALSKNDFLKLDIHCTIFQMLLCQQHVAQVSRLRYKAKAHNQCAHTLWFDHAVI